MTNESTDAFQVTCQPGFNGGLPQHFTLTIYKVSPENAELNLSANLSSALPTFTVSGLDPGSKYVGELVGHNVKGTLYICENTNVVGNYRGASNSKAANSAVLNKAWS